MGFFHRTSTNESPLAADTPETFCGGLTGGSGVTGGLDVPCTSSTVTVDVRVTRFPDASVAANVTVLTPMGISSANPVQLSFGCGSMRSWAVADANQPETDPHGIAHPAEEVVETTSGAGIESAGGVVSTTFTVNVVDATLCCASDAAHVTVVAPSGKFEPDTGLQRTGTGPSTESLAAGDEYVAIDPPGPFASTDTPPGTLLMVGGVVSTTLTANEPVACFPLASVAVQLTVVDPIGKAEPEAGLQLTPGLASTMSLAVAEKPTVAPALLVASAVIVPGRFNVGGVVSTTVTVKVAAALVFPCESVAVHDTFVVPKGNVLPLDDEQLTGTLPSTVSVADAVQLTVAPPVVFPSTDMFDGTCVRLGAVVSWTVTLNDTVACVLSTGSVAVHVTGVVPSGNVEPVSGLQDTVGVFAPPSSVADGTV